MISKKDYLTYLNYEVKTCPSIYDAFKELIDNYFKLLDNYNKLEKTSYSLEGQLYEIYYPNPYKFEDLKPNMWIWNKDFNGWGEILRIVETRVNKYGEKLVKCLATGDSSLQTRLYKENRFFPVEKAMEVK